MDNIPIYDPLAWERGVALAYFLVHVLAWLRYPSISFIYCSAASIFKGSSAFSNPYIGDNNNNSSNNTNKKVLELEKEKDKEEEMFYIHGYLYISIFIFSIISKIGYLQRKG